MSLLNDCATCRGSGEIYVGAGYDDPYTHDVCPDCDGTGDNPVGEPT